MTKRDLFLIELKKNFGNKTVACKKAGVSPQQIEREIKQNIDFAEKVWRIRESFIDQMESTMIRLAIAGEFKHLSYYLDNNAKHRGYGKEEGIGFDADELRKTKVKQNIKKMSNEELEQYRKLIE